MSSKIKPIVRFQGVSKKYKYKDVLNHRTLRSKLANLLNSKDHKTIHALKSIDLDVFSGEKIGIIGENGSGKSTLLKILCKITPPSSGRVEIYSSISAMLEIGAGFHPELTGYENVLFNGSILGLSRTYIELKTKDIISFSGLSEHIHMPLKKYSTGMIMRLATSIAFFLNAEILVLDEILITGDLEFINKCLSKMNEINKSNNNTIIIVSHNLDLLKGFCNRVIWMEEGKISMDGDPITIIKAYKDAAL